MLFQVLCGFEPIFYTTHPNEESKKKDLFAYTISKKGNVKKISKSYYDSKKQTVNFTTKSFSKFAVGGRL